MATDYRAIAENYFQKTLLPDEVVHHIDGDHENNDPENLVIMKASQHNRLHGGLLCALDEWLNKVRSPVCNTCLFVRVYDEIPHWGLDLAAFMIGLMIRSKVNEISLASDVSGVIKEIYESCTAWKKLHDHDCYECLNMHVTVRGGKNDN